MKKLLGVLMAAMVAFPAGGWSAQFEQDLSPSRPVAPLSVSALAPLPGLAAGFSPAASAALPRSFVSAASAPAAKAVLPSLMTISASVRPGQGRRKGGEGAALGEFFDGRGGRDEAPAASEGGSGDHFLGLSRSEGGSPAHHGVPSFHQLHSPLGERARHFYENFAYLMRQSVLPIVLIAGLGLSIGAGVSGHHESARALSYPLGFSEITQIERDAHYAGKTVGPMTRYMTSTNDLVMKVLESYDEANEQTWVGGNEKEFARNLDYRIRYKFHHYEIQDYFRDLPAQAQAARAELQDFDKAKTNIDGADAHLDRAWDESHVDHYHTHYWTTQEPNSDGKGTHTEEHSEQVYDDTTHSYDYHPRQGNEGSAELNAAVAAGPLNFTEQLQTASQTNAEGEYAADRSRRQERAGKGDLTAQELLDISRTWKTGSTLMSNLPGIQAGWQTLAGDARDWSSAKNSAHSDSYTTTSRSDDGPREYQVSQKAESDGQDFSNAVGEVLQGIDFTQANTGVLAQKVHELIGVELDYQKGDNPKKLTKQIVQIAQDMYTANFKKGFDYERFRWGMVALFGMLGGLGGGLLGWLYSYMIGRFDWFRTE